MYRLGAGLLRDLENFVRAQVTVTRSRVTDTPGLVASFDV
jgi:hypothetical protein